MEIRSHSHRNGHRKFNLKYLFLKMMKTLSSHSIKIPFDIYSTLPNQTNQNVLKINVEMAGHEEVSGYADK